MYQGTYDRANSTRPLEDTFARVGLDGLTDCEVVQLLLGLLSRRNRPLERAEEYIRQFGSLRAFLEASCEELQQQGLTGHAALCIKLIFEIPARVLKQRMIDEPVFESSQKVFDYLYYTMCGLKSEVFKVIYLNARNQIIENSDLSVGTMDSAPVSARDVIERAIRCRAVSMIFVHNHPSGDPSPSRQDKQLTRDLVFAGSVMQIRVMDHIVIGDNCYFSFAGEELIQQYEDSFLTLRIRRAI